MDIIIVFYLGNHLIKIGNLKTYKIFSLFYRNAYKALSLSMVNKSVQMHENSKLR